MKWDLDLVRIGERLKEKEIRLLCLRRPTAEREEAREERTRTGSDHLWKNSNFMEAVKNDRGYEVELSRWGKIK